MFNKTSMKFLEQLMRSASPTGYESEAAKIFKNYLSDCCDVKCDVMGNTIAALNPDAPVRVMLAGHYDEIGFQIVYISEEGLLYFRTNGGIDKLNVPSSEVDILSANGRIPGVIGKKPIHLLTPAEREKAIEIKDMWIDIGASSRKEAEKLVAVGDPVVMRENFRMLNKNRFISKGTDDKIGAFIVAETMRRLAARKLNVAVYGVGTTQEEVGLRGATAGVYAVNPHIGFGIDVGFATDLPDISKKQYGDITLGKGPALSHSCDNNIVLGKIIRATAKAHKIPYQESVAHRATGGTDTAAMQLSRGGVATALFSIPNRYMHSQVEMCDLRDAAAAIDLLTETIAGFTGNESFIPVE